MILLFIWAITAVLLIYLLVGTATRRASERLANARNIREFRKHHHYDAKRGKWVRHSDGATTAEANPVLRRVKRAGGLAIFVLWEGFWLFQIASAQKWSQIPYLFLLVMMIGIPFAAYKLSRRIEE